MIGFYNYSVILTYIGLASSIYGMTLALYNHPKWAILCLMISGFCDMFDGKIARAMKRTEDEKKFGIQIDSLCDVICFGVFPVIIGFSLGVRGVFGDLVLILYVLAAVIRLAYFNVMEEKRQEETEEVRKVYQGLPVTSIAILLPIIYITKNVFNNSFSVVLGGSLFVIAVLFVTDIKVKKPGNRAVGVFMILAAIILIRLWKIH